MSRRTSLGALVLALVVLVAQPAAAKGPTQVEVRDLRSGVTTLLRMLDKGEMHALGEVVGWPQGQREPLGVSRGVLVPVVTLHWQLDDDMPAWTDRIYADDRGRAWVQRRDYLSGSGPVSWGRISSFAFDAVLTAIQERPGETTTHGAPDEDPARDPAAVGVPTPDPIRDPERETPARLHAASFGWGAGLAALLAAGLGLVTRRRRCWSTRPARA